jgi:hypothetical protein
VRANRIGQTKTVKVYRLLTNKSYETAMFQAASLKLGLDYAVMNKMKGGSTGLAGITKTKAEHVSSLTRRELENLLKVIYAQADSFFLFVLSISPSRSKFLFTLPVRRLAFSLLLMFTVFYC